MAYFDLRTFGQVNIAGIKYIKCVKGDDQPEVYVVDNYGVKHHITSYAYYRDVVVPITGPFHKISVEELNKMPTGPSVPSTEMPTPGLAPIVKPLPKLRDLPSPGIAKPGVKPITQKRTYRIVCSKCGSTLEVTKSVPTGVALPLVYDGPAFGKKLYCPVCGNYIGYGDSIKVIVRKSWPPKEGDIVDIHWTPPEKTVTETPLPKAPETPIWRFIGTKVITCPHCGGKIRITSSTIGVFLKNLTCPYCGKVIAKVPLLTQVSKVTPPPSAPVPTPAPPITMPGPPAPTPTYKVPEIEKDVTITCHYCGKKVMVKVPPGIHLFWDDFRCPWCGKVIVHAPIGTRLYKVGEPAPGPEAPKVPEEKTWVESLFTKEVTCSRCGSILRLTLPLKLPIPTIAPPVMFPQYCPVCGNFIGMGIKIDIVQAMPWPPTAVAPEVPLVKQVPSTPPEWQYPYTDQYQALFTRPYVPGGKYSDIDGSTLPIEAPKKVEEKPKVEVKPAKAIPWGWLALGGVGIYAMSKKKGKVPETKGKSLI